MRAAATTSPFAADNQQELQEQWIVWKKQEIKDAYIQTDRRSERLPAAELPASQEPQMVSMPRPVYRHRQYDAVISRMKAAQKQVGTYSDWT